MRIFGGKPTVEPTVESTLRHENEQLRANAEQLRAEAEQLRAEAEQSSTLQLRIDEMRRCNLELEERVAHADALRKQAGSQADNTTEQLATYRARVRQLEDEKATIQRKLREKSDEFLQLTSEAETAKKKVEKGNEWAAKASALRAKNKEASRHLSSRTHDSRFCHGPHVRFLSAQPGAPAPTLQ
jgi:chromosome segregation ATPase